MFSYRHRIVRCTSAWILIQALAFSQMLPPFALAEQNSTLHSETLRIEQPESKAGLEELRADLQAGIARGKPGLATFQVGLEEPPATANPLSGQFQPALYEIASPVGQTYSATPPPVFDGNQIDPAAVVNAMESAFQQTGQGHVSVRFPINRVAGQGKLWQGIPAEVRLLLERLYDLQYNLFEQRSENVLSGQDIELVVDSLNHKNRAVAAAARDVMVAVRAYHLQGTLRRIATVYEQKKGTFGEYAKLSYADALTTIIDPATQTELGNPYRALFDANPDAAAIHQGVQFLFDLQRRDTWLKSFSGIRGPFSIAMGTNGYPVVDLQTDIGSQITDPAKVATAHIVQEFVRLIPEMQGKDGGQPKEKLRIAVMMDPRYSGPAVAQVIIRTLVKLGHEVIFAGIGSAPEAAARALLSQGQVDSTIFISSSHVQEGTNGFKLMLWSGQILPADEAKRFIRSFVQSAKDPGNTRQLIVLLSDSGVNDAVAQVMRQLPQAYADSKRLYNGYGDQIISGQLGKPAAEVEPVKRAIRQRLTEQKVVVLYDPNGGSGVADLEFLQGWAPYLISMNDAFRLFAHDLAPWEASTRQARDVVSALEKELRKRGYTVIIIGTDTDRDRRFMLFRDPKSREYAYPGPQALFILDALYHVLTNRKAGKNKIAIVGNDPTTPRVEVLSGPMGYVQGKAEVGEANVVALMRQYIGQGYETMGGEGSNASTMRYPLMVRDMLLALGSVFGFMGDRTLVVELINLVVKDPTERQTLLARVDDWYRPENLPDLFHHILYDILPPEAITDTFDVSEQRKGVGVPQIDFKNALDGVVQDVIGPAIKREVARELRRALGDRKAREVEQRFGGLENRITYRIVNYEGTERLVGAGNRRTNEGGYLVEMLYLDEKGQEHLLGWLWTRESQTELGTARRIVALVNDFLPRKKARQFVDNLYKRLYPLWVDALNLAEARALERIAGQLPPDSPKIAELRKATEDTRKGTQQLFGELWHKHANPRDQANYSRNVQRNLQAERLRVQAGLAVLSTLWDRTGKEVDAIEETAYQADATGRLTKAQASDLNRRIERLLENLDLQALQRSATRRIDPRRPTQTLSSNDLAYVTAQNLVIGIFQERIHQLLGGLTEARLQATGKRPEVDRLVRQLRSFVSEARGIRGILGEDPSHYAHVHLIAAEIILGRVGLEEDIAQVPVNNRILAIELGGTFIRASLVDSQTGEVLAEVPDVQIQYPVQPAKDSQNVGPVLNQIIQQIGLLLNQTGLPLEEIGMVSASVAGDLNEETGLVLLQNNLPFTGKNLRDLIAGQLGIDPARVLISNDMTAAVRAEALYGGGQGRQLVAYLTASTGTNAAYRAPSGMAVDLGLWGYPAYDGKTVEEHTAGTHLARRARESTPEPGWQEIVALAGGNPEQITGVHVGQAFAQGNPLARKVVEDAARVFGRAIVQATEKIAAAGDLSQEPEVLWIAGGGVSQGIGAPFIQLIQEVVDQELVGSTVNCSIRIALSQMPGSRRGLLGAAARAKEITGLEEPGAKEMAERVARIERFARELGISIPDNARIHLFVTRATSGRGHPMVNEVLSTLPKEMGIQMPYVYVPYLIPDGNQEEFRTVVRAVRQGIRLSNGAQVVTASAGTPFKLAGADLSDERDSRFPEIEGAEMFVRRDDGRLWSTIVDADATADWFEETVGPLKGLKVVVLGLGEVGAVFVDELERRGALEVTAADPDPTRVERVRSRPRGPGFILSLVESDDPARGTASQPLHEKIAQADVVFNMTGLGKPDSSGSASPLVETGLRYAPGAVVVDMNYWLKDENFLTQAERVTPQVRRKDGAGIMVYSIVNILDILFKQTASVSVDKARIKTSVQSAAIRHGLLPVGLEEPLKPSKLIEGWDVLSQPDRKRLSQQLKRAVDADTLQRLVEYAQHPVNPPATLYEILSIVLEQPMDTVQQTIESLSTSAYLAPQTRAVGESTAIAWSPNEVRDLLENTVIVIAAGGGGARFKRSLWEALREQLKRLHRLEKPTVVIGPSGTSPVIQTLEELSELTRLVGAYQVQVVVVTAPDSHSAVVQDIEQGNQWFDQGRVRISVAKQGTFPSFNPQTGKILTTVNPDTHRIELLRNPNGTYGAFVAGYQLAQRKGFARGKSWLVLYGDDPILNTGDFIARVLTVGKDLDVAPVATPKISRTSPVGGTIVDVALPGGRVLHLIVEKAEREPDLGKGIPGLPVFNQVEDEAAQAGRDPFGFNTGVLKLSEEAAAVSASLTLPLRHADRERDDLPGQMRRNMERFATHITGITGNRPELKFGVLQVDPAQYGAAKDYKAVASATASRNERSRRHLDQMLQGSSVQVSIDPAVSLDVRPGFRGFQGQGKLTLTGPMGAVLAPDGLTLVPIVQRDPSNQHPVFADPGQGQLVFPANPDGTITLSGDHQFSNTGLEEIATKPVVPPITFNPSAATSTTVGPAIATVTALRSTVSNVPVIQVPSNIGNNRRAFVITPDGLGKMFVVLSVLRGGELPEIDALANNAEHKQHVLAGLEELGLTNVRVHDVATEFNGNVGEAIAALQMQYWQAGRDTLVVTALTGLEEVAKFLGIPEAVSAFRSLEFVIQKSQSVWS